MNRTQKPSGHRTKTTQHRLQLLSTVLLAVARTIGFVAAVIGIFKALRTAKKTG